MLSDEINSKSESNVSNSLTPRIPENSDKDKISSS